MCHAALYLLASASGDNVYCGGPSGHGLVWAVMVASVQWFVRRVLGYNGLVDMRTITPLGVDLATSRLDFMHEMQGISDEVLRWLGLNRGLVRRGVCATYRKKHQEFRSTPGFTFGPGGQLAVRNGWYFGVSDERRQSDEWWK